MAKSDAETSEAKGFGGALMGLGKLFQSDGGLKNTHVEQREADERLAIKTDKQREQARGRTRSSPVSFRFLPETSDLLSRLHKKLKKEDLSKTDIVELAITEFAKKHGLEP